MRKKEGRMKRGIRCGVKKGGRKGGKRGRVGKGERKQGECKQKDRRECRRNGR